MHIFGSVSFLNVTNICINPWLSTLATICNNGAEILGQSEDKCAKGTRRMPEARAGRCAVTYTHKCTCSRVVLIRSDRN